VAAAGRAAAARLDALLVAPLRTAVGDRDLVLVPPPALAGLPWHALPSLAARPVVLAPSATTWARARERPAAAPGMLVAAGPGLPHADREAREVALAHPGATLLRGPDATAGAVRAALGTAGRAHLAAHGRFRADNPLFSALLLADGPLTVYEVEALPQVPEGIVLSACDLGDAANPAGDEVVGLAGALLALGARWLVAAVLPAPDAATRALMGALHRGLAEGLAPAAALARARGALDDRDPAAHAAAAAFACFGGG
jgi:CHAT domain-containing protein